MPCQCCRSRNRRRYRSHYDLLWHPPNRVNLPGGYHGTNPATAIDYFEAVYTAGPDGWLRAVTVLFPEDGTHAKVPMKRLSDTGCTGANIHHSPTLVDTFLASDSVGTFSHSGVSFCGTGIFYRTVKETITSYAVTNGQMFHDGNIGQTGFRSNKNINLQMDSDTGHIESKGSVVVFYAPGLVNIKINGNTVPSFPANGGLRIKVPPGRHTVELIK